MRIPNPSRRFLEYLLTRDPEGAPMNITRRDAIALSGSSLAGVSLGLMSNEEIGAQAAPQAPQEWPDQLV